MTISNIHLSLPSEAATKRLAKAFARQMIAGDMILLNGGLAAGKTFFVQAAVAALGSSDAVSSPTYTLANIYTCPLGPIVHVDAYRLEGPAEFADLALEDECELGVSFIEWGDRLKGEFDDFVMIDLSLVSEEETARSASLSAFGPRGTALMAAATKDYAS